jgi:hypothetical protein
VRRLEMDTETLERPCMNCGRRTHRLLHDGNGIALCGSARLAGYEPPGCAKWETADELGRPTTRYVRAKRNGRRRASSAKLSDCAPR